ncbi:MAG: redoxin domain-containing protein [Planctomycetota bacterium]
MPAARSPTSPRPHVPPLPARSSRKNSIGKVAPDIKGVDVDGTEFSLSDYRGKVVFLDFWGHGRACQDTNSNVEDL